MKIGVSLPVREMADDLESIVAFAQLAESLGFTHLRIPDQVIRPDSGHLREPLTLLSYIAAVTSKIELVPSCIILPLRQTALVAKQTAELDRLSGGRLRLGVGVGINETEYQAMGADFRTRGRNCDEQIQVLKRLWCEPQVTFNGRFHELQNVGINPLPVQRPIPIWIGARAEPVQSVINRIAQLSDGWFVLATPEQFPAVSGAIAEAAREAGRDPSEIGTEAGVAVVGPREAEWKDRVRNWRATGLTHLCLRTLGGDLGNQQHLDKLAEVADQIPED